MITVILGIFGGENYSSTSELVHGVICMPISCKETGSKQDPEHSERENGTLSYLMIYLSNVSVN